MRLSFLAMVLAILSLGACNTIEGAGEDIEAGGEAVEGAAQENTPY